MSLGTSPPLPSSHASRYDTIIIMKTSKWVSEQGSEKKAANSVCRIFPFLPHPFSQVSISTISKMIFTDRRETDAYRTEDRYGITGTVP